MRRIIYFTLSSFCLCVNAQTIQFIDKLDNTPVSFASVSWNNGGTFTDESGTIVLGTDDVKQIRFSHICYNDTTIRPLKGMQKVYVTPKAYTLDNIEICAKERKRIKLRSIGLSNLKSESGFGGKNGMEMALYIGNHKAEETTYIHNIQACLDFINGEIKNRNIIDAELRFDIRDCVIRNGNYFPGNKSYIHGGVLYRGVKKSGLKKIPLLQPIVFPKEGVFVTIEWICPGKKINDITNAGIMATVQAPKVETYIKESGKWLLIQDRDFEKKFSQEYLKGKYRNIKIGLQVSK